jgi:hypothetical protein
VLTTAADADGVVVSGSEIAVEPARGAVCPRVSCDEMRAGAAAAVEPAGPLTLATAECFDAVPVAAAVAVLVMAGAGLSAPLAPVEPPLLADLVPPAVPATVLAAEPEPRAPADPLELPVPVVELASWLPEEGDDVPEGESSA